MYGMHHVLDDKTVKLYLKKQLWQNYGMYDTSITKKKNLCPDPVWKPVTQDPSDPRSLARAPAGLPDPGHEDGLVDIYIYIYV